jgi:hypothetical protein
MKLLIEKLRIYEQTSPREWLARKNYCATIENEKRTPVNSFQSSPIACYRTPVSMERSTCAVGLK